MVLTQVVLLNNFAKGVEHLNIANGLTAIAVSIAIFSMGIYMLVRVKKQKEKKYFNQSE